MEAPTMNRQRGFTLIEMLVVITVGSTMAGIAVFMLHALMKSHNTGREHLEYCRTINRMAEQFGGDNAGLVKIEVKPVADQSKRRLIKVQADFPDDPQDRVRYSKELTLELP
jgi:prepilin-type N-terminal cleavage/methylation domain-containing protein